MRGTARIALSLHKRIAKSNSAKQQPPCAPSVSSLLRIKQLALRRRIWFKALNHLERGIIDLTVKTVDQIKSSKLAQVVTGIIDKLEAAMESLTSRLARTVGLPLAQKLSDLAVSWGNRSAREWAHDMAFAKYLAVTKHNLG